MIPWWGWLLLTVFVFLPLLYFLVIVILAVALDIDIHNIFNRGKDDNAFGGERCRFRWIPCGKDGSCPTTQCSDGVCTTSGKRCRTIEDCPAVTLTCKKGCCLPTQMDEKEAFAERMRII